MNFFIKKPIENNINIKYLDEIQKFLEKGLFLNYIWTPIFFNSRKLSFLIILAQIFTVLLIINSGEYIFEDN